LCLIIQIGAIATTVAATSPITGTNIKNRSGVCRRGATTLPASALLTLLPPRSTPIFNRTTCSTNPVALLQQAGSTPARNPYPSSPMQMVQRKFLPIAALFLSTKN
jgi:hypothetical protein